MIRWLVVAAIAAGAAGAAVAGGWSGLLVYGFFVGLAAAIAYGAAHGGEWVRGASRGRFDRRS
jgi:hypothetical protein